MPEPPPRQARAPYPDEVRRPSPPIADWSANEPNFSHEPMRNDAPPRVLSLSGSAYDNDSSLWLWRTLALADGYTQRYVSVNAVDGTRQTVSLAITARQRVTVPAGGFDTWRLQVRNGRATGVAWINVQPPYQVVQWDNGSLVFQLEPAG